MIINIPTDVVSLIFSYLSFDTGFSNIIFTSKNFNKIANSSIEIKKYKLFLESINMLKNDKTYEKNYDNLNLLWEKYHNYRWKNKYDTFFKVGDIIDAKDCVKAWCPAKIIKKSLKNTRKFDHELKEYFTSYQYVYSVKFEGWNEHYNEDLELTHIKPLGYYTVNPVNKLKSITTNKNESIWCLLKNEENIWKVQKVNFRSIENENVKFVINNGDVITIPKKNIEQNVSSFSNATVFLSNCQHQYFSHIDTFYY